MTTGPENPYGEQDPGTPPTHQPYGAPPPPAPPYGDAAAVRQHRRTASPAAAGAVPAAGLRPAAVPLRRSSADRRARARRDDHRHRGARAARARTASGCSASPVALILGKVSMNRIKRSQGQLGGRGMALTGFILGIIGTVLLVLAIIAVVIIVVVAINDPDAFTIAAAAACQDDGHDDGPREPVRRAAAAAVPAAAATAAAAAAALRVRLPAALPAAGAQPPVGDDGDGARHHRPGRDPDLRRRHAGALAVRLGDRRPGGQGDRRRPARAPTAAATRPTPAGSWASSARSC